MDIKYYRRRQYSCYYQLTKTTMKTKGWAVVVDGYVVKAGTHEKPAISLKSAEDAGLIARSYAYEEDEKPVVVPCVITYLE